MRVVATGHDLDDVAATLLGNTLRWQTVAIARRSPVLPTSDGMVKKVKPQLRSKESMKAIEATSPGTKAQVFLGFLERGSALFEVLPVELFEGTAP